MRPADDTSGDRRVTVVEAAAILGITPDAVRSRLRRGTLRRDQGPDGEVLVILDGDQSVDRSATDRPTVALIEALEDQIAYLRQQAALWQEEARRKDHLLAAALERIPELPQASSQEPTDGPTEAPEGSGKGDVPPEHEKGSERRSWWRRVFGR
jgi:hypothetical protein